MLVDGLGKALGQPDDFLRVNGDYPLGTYSYSGSVSDTVGGSASVTAQMTFVGPLAVTALSLQQSPDKSAWTAVTGNLAGGYTVALDGLPASWTYLDVASLTANRTLVDGYYGFALGQAGLPADWLTYWAARGVDASATGWQGQMWQIINGNAPIFYLKVSGGGSSYMLVDGLGKALGQPDDFLRVNGDYPLGTYSYSGSVSDTVGGSAAVTAQMTFAGPLAVTALSLEQSPDKSAWMAVTGDLAGGYVMSLVPTQAWTYLDVASLTANRTLADGYYGFALGQAGLPANWLAYWAAKGVVAGATGWQGQMWQIINGNAPIFYLKVSGGGSSYMLVDGLGKALGQPDDFLRVNGDYPLGTYTYTGAVADAIGGTYSRAIPDAIEGTTTLSVNMTFQAPTAVRLGSLAARSEPGGWPWPVAIVVMGALIVAGRRTWKGLKR